MISDRLARDGEAVCDDPTHIDVLADHAWHLAWLEAQRMPSGAKGCSDAEEDTKDAVQTVKYCADVRQARRHKRAPPCQMSNALPLSELLPLRAVCRGEL
jgi:hypothetical protein